MLARKRKYADARARLEDARLCFDWAGGAEAELRELHSVGSELEVCCLRTRPFDVTVVFVRFEGYA